MIRVRALGDPEKVVGYHNHRRIKGGEVFDINDEKEFSSNWMEKIDSSIKPTMGTKTTIKRGKKIDAKDDSFETGSAVPAQEDEDVL
ncbi:MAG: hypothetical protein A4E53_01664 [Pelotomaculum sp. PtaB.Bin104]|nr:MAG: hypothetical protein A4E53_01664 [Pelotomaculum sp. PtaB.Bin104]